MYSERKKKVFYFLCFVAVMTRLQVKDCFALQREPYLCLLICIDAVYIFSRFITCAVCYVLVSEATFRFLLFILRKGRLKCTACCVIVAFLAKPPNSCTQILYRT